MKKKKFTIICLCALGAAVLSLNACNCGGDKGGNAEIGDYLKSMKASADRAVSLDAEVKISDGDVTVYSFTRHMEIDVETHTASVADTTVTLSANFEENTVNSTVSVDNVTGETIIGLKLSSELLSSYELAGGDLVCTVARENVSAVLARAVSASSAMTLTIDFEDGNLVKAEYSYVNSASRTVSVSVRYGY